MASMTPPAAVCNVIKGEVREYAYFWPHLAGAQRNVISSPFFPSFPKAELTFWKSLEESAERRGGHADLCARLLATCARTSKASRLRASSGLTSQARQRGSWVSQGLPAAARPSSGLWNLWNAWHTKPDRGGDSGDLRPERRAGGLEGAPEPVASTGPGDLWLWSKSPQPSRIRTSVTPIHLVAPGCVCFTPRHSPPPLSGPQFCFGIWGDRGNAQWPRPFPIHPIDHARSQPRFS